MLCWVGPKGRGEWGLYITCSQIFTKKSKPLIYSHILLCYNLLNYPWEGKMYVTKVVESASASAMQTDVNTFLSGTICCASQHLLKEITIASRFDDNGGKYIAMIIYWSDG